MEKISISINKYGATITKKEVAEKILSDINLHHPESNVIEVDMNGILAMTTQCANIIFGTLYTQLGSDNYFKNIILKNASKAIRFVIDMGLNHAKARVL